MASSNLADSSSYKHNNDIIEELHANDFVYLEKDLEFYDKVWSNSSSPQKIVGQLELKISICTEIPAGFN